MSSIIKAALAAVMGATMLSGAVSQAQAQNVVWRFGHENQATVPAGKAVDMLAALVAARSNGRFKIDVFPAAQLGKEAQLIEQVQLGTLEMMFTPTAPLSKFEPKLQVIDLPFLFPDRPTAYKVLDGEIGQKLLDGMGQKGFKAIAFWESGFKQLTTSGSPIHSLADLKGLKIRTMQSPLLIAQYESWGASPIPISFTETYNALQQGIAQAQENPLTSINAMRFYEVQKSLTLSNHGYTAMMPLINIDKYESLPADLRDVLEGAMKDTRTWLRAENQRIDEQLLEKMSATLQIVRLTPEERTGFIKAAREFHKSYADRVGPDTLAAIYAVVDGAQ